MNMMGKKVACEVIWDERYPALFVREWTNPMVQFMLGDIYLDDKRDSLPVKYQMVPAELVREYNIASELMRQVERKFRALDGN